VPVTVHVGIGYDIVCMMPEYNGGEWGAASDTDFLILAHTMSQVFGGTILNVATAIMGPEVFMKAVCLARQVTGSPTSYTMAVFDWRDPKPWLGEAEPITAHYSDRQYKSMLKRLVPEDGNSIVVNDLVENSIPQLWSELNGLKEGN
jgi:hypothetical protein